MPLRIAVNYGRDAALEPEALNEDRPMGGIRTATLALCAALARRGHDVHLFAVCPRRGLRDGIAFHDRAEFAGFGREQSVYSLVAIPEVLPLLMPLRPRARVVWSGNAFQAGDCALSARWSWATGIGRAGETARLYTMERLHPYADRLVVKSHWQAEYMWSTLGIPRDKFVVAYNGVPLEYYRGPAVARHRHRLVYTSQVRRGLDRLLDLFPRIRAAVPEAELHIFGYEHTDAQALRDLHGATQPGVHWRGSLGKRALAHELRSAGLMAYPCTLKETFCTAVAEAQAAGLPVVTSDRAALAERVTNGVEGFVIPGHAREHGYQEAFVEAVVRLLQDDDLWTRLGWNAARKAHRLYDWDTIAASWEAELQRAIAGREPLPPRLDPTLDLLAPEALTVADRGMSAQVPPALAERWLRGAWAAYGYHVASTPGLVRSSAVTRRGRSPRPRKLRAPGTRPPEREHHQATATSAPQATETSQD